MVILDIVKVSVLVTPLLKWVERLFTVSMDYISFTHQSFFKIKMNSYLASLPYP